MDYSTTKLQNATELLTPVPSSISDAFPRTSSRISTEEKTAGSLLIS